MPNNLAKIWAAKYMKWMDFQSAPLTPFDIKKVTRNLLLY